MAGSLRPLDGQTRSFEQVVTAASPVHGAKKYAMMPLLLIAAAVVGQDVPASLQSLDLADPSCRNCWIRHPVWGDPSFDSFERMPDNPVLRGSAPYAWPVNGFLFQDPPSGNWYLYVGNYLEGYRLDPQYPSICTIFRSVDKGTHWEALGPAFTGPPHIFEGETAPMSSAPDVTVVFSEGAYHMCFDWTTRNTTWENAATPGADANSGVGYARAERPEGPFQPSPRPIATTRTQEPLLGKYKRLYASTLIRRSNDWLVLTLTDSGPYFGWALLAMVSKNPDGPYSQPELLLHPESPSYHPPLLEFFPAFVHDGFVYSPATSVARNRNFQCIFRAPIEEAHLPSSWTIEQHGSLWHAVSTENEYHGMWGQTFSGFVDEAAFLNVLFPSRDARGNGTINLARRKWESPYREKGFAASAHGGPTFLRTKDGCTPETLSLRFSWKGTIALIWDAHAPLGADVPRSDASLHPLMLGDNRFLELSDGGWRLGGRDAKGTETTLTGGKLPGKPERADLAVTWSDGQASIVFDATLLWRGELTAGAGALGLLLAPSSNVALESFAVQGHFAPSTVTLLYTEALLGAAQGFVNWERLSSPLYRYGEGAASKGEKHGACAKWNFDGAAFTLWAPKGPQFGEAELLLDGRPLVRKNFHASSEIASMPVFTHRAETAGFHALMMKPLGGGIIPLDCLEVSQDPL